MDSWVRFSAQSQAKERVFRAAQYACTLLSYALQKNGAGPDFVARIKQLEAHLSLGRKLFRLGNSADALEAAKRAIHLSDIVLRFCITVSHLNRAMYFACDNILWAGKSGLVPHMDQEKWSQRSFSCSKAPPLIGGFAEETMQFNVESIAQRGGALLVIDQVRAGETFIREAFLDSFTEQRYYLFALIMNLSRDAYEIRLLMEREVNGKCRKSSCGSDGPAPGEDRRMRRLKQRLRLLAQVLRSNPPLLLDVMKNACDIFIPLDKLGLCKSSSGFVGLCGLTSSILSILTIVHPWLKLKP